MEGHFNPFNSRGSADRIKNSGLFILDLQIAKDKYDLTPTETKVAYLAAMGKSNKDIANELAVETSTVTTHLKQVYLELEISSPDGAAKCRNKILPKFLISGVVKFQESSKRIYREPKEIELDPHFLIDESAAKTKYSLTPQEIQVSYLLAVGNGANDIAEKLFLSDSTIKTHLLSIFRKMGFSDLDGKKGSNQAKLLPKFLMDGVIGFNG